MLKLTGLHSWIGLLSPAVRERVLARMRPRRFPDGGVVFLVGDLPREAFLIREGRVRICNHTQTGAEIVLVTFQAGDCFGENSLFDGLPRFNNAYAVGETELLVLSKADFEDLYNTETEIARALILMLCYRLRIVSGLSEDASVLTLKQRLARLLVRLAYSFGDVGSSRSTIVPGVSHEDLSCMLGATRQGVSRALKELEDAGAVRLSYRRILINDLEQFAREHNSLIGGEAVVPDYHREPP